MWQEGVIPVFNHDVCGRNATREHTEEAYRVQATVEELKEGQLYTRSARFKSNELPNGVVQNDPT